MERVMGAEAILGVSVSWFCKDQGHVIGSRPILPCARIGDRTVASGRWPVDEPLPRGHRSLPPPQRARKSMRYSTADGGPISRPPTTAQPPRWMTRWTSGPAGQV